MEGLYFNENESSISLLRFYEDGTVIGVSIAPTNFESIGENLAWFDIEKYNPLWNKGSYEIFDNEISFKLSSTISMQNCSGEISSDKIFLQRHNLSNGNITKSIYKKYDLTQNLSNYKVDEIDKTFLNSKVKRDISSNISLMLEFGPEKLVEEFSEQYINEKGNNKYLEIAKVVNTSERVKTYIAHLLSTSSQPDFHSLQLLMNSHSFFRWAKEESVCLGALGVVYKWSAEAYGHNRENDQILSKIIATVIERSSESKINQFNNFFHRYYRNLVGLIS